LTELDADGAACDFVAGADQVIVDVNDRVGRHGKSDALVAVGLGKDGRIDADHFAIHVEQRAAGVAGIDGCIGLDEVLKLAAGTRLNGAVLGRDDACGYRLVKRKRTANGLDPVANIGCVGVAQRDGGKWRVGIDLDDRQIGCLVYSDDPRWTAQIL